ncbi:hypothetical protein G7Y89_g9091 [Cudoniella acicularis]|uniref:Uncharacterized protein n=1 Tax=Cudoniella acicularis TaxID=354080 RepID=A0A8H4RFB6_9HELO|nr:hypothetical protein G7Y89_g9091 [Cudoniella acicularis]
MASDASLYGIRKPKNTSKEISSSTSLAFTSTLSSLLSTSSRTHPSTGRPRPSKQAKDDIFSSHNRNTKKRAARDLEDSDDDGRGRPRTNKDIGTVDEAMLHRSKRKLEKKAKLYKEMKKTDYASKEGEDVLVDFDRKWAEADEKGELSPSDSEMDGDSREIVEYEDEFGRMRRGTKAEADRMEKRKQNKVLGQEELNRMSARPAMPSIVIYGDTIQTLAFNPDEPILEKMEEIARKRDRSMTPPEMKHYEADKEFRIKGVGFYSFSKDEKVRKDEMEALEKERLETERVRKEREEKKQQRKKEIEERRKAIGEKRAKKQADNFLEGLSGDLGPSSTL